MANNTTPPKVITSTPVNEILKYTTANAMIPVTLGNYKIQLGQNGSRGLYMATLSGSTVINGFTYYHGPSGFDSLTLTDISITTVYKRIHPSWSFGNMNDRQIIHFSDNTGSVWEFSMWTGSAFVDNKFQMIKIK